MVPDKTPEERSIAQLIYGNVDDCRHAVRSENDAALLTAALAGARELREGKSKIALIERRLREIEPPREVLLTCPCCGTPNFSARGLRSHQCRAKPERARLTSAELEIARQRAGRAA